MMANWLKCALAFFLCMHSLQALLFPFNIRNHNWRIITSTLSKISKILPVPPAFALGDGGSKALLPPPPSDMAFSMSGSEHSNTFVALIAATNRTMESFTDKKANTNSIQKWWKEQSDGRSGILVLLLPALMMQLQIFAATAPFVIERLTQYLNPPLAILTGIALLRPINGISFLRRALWASMAVGAVTMLYDSYTAGAGWSPLQPAEDSYAVITGSDQLIGRELSKKLYDYGYNLVLIGESADELQGLKQALLDSAPQPVVPIIPAPQRLVADLAKQCEKIPLFVSEQVEKVPDLQRGVERIKEITQLWSSQPAVQQCVKQIRSHLQLNTTTFPTISGLMNAAPLRSQSLVAHVRYAAAESNHSMHNVAESYAARGSTDSRWSTVPLLSKQATTRQSDAASISEYRPRDIQVIVSDWADPQAPYKAAVELKERQLADKVEVLVHAADKHCSGPLSAASASSVQQMLQKNVHSAVAFTQLLLPGMLKRCGGGTTSVNDHRERPRPLATAVARLCNLGRHQRVVRKVELKESSSPETDGVAMLSATDDNKHRCGGGRILFVSSLGAAGPSPCSSVYAASKAFLSSFAQSLRRELLPAGVLVTVANCGAIRGVFPSTADQLQSSACNIYNAEGATQCDHQGAGAVLPELPAPPLMLMPPPPPVIPAPPLPPLIREDSDLYSTAICHVDACSNDVPPPSTTADAFGSAQNECSFAVGQEENRQTELLSGAASTGVPARKDKEQHIIPKYPFIYKLPGGTMSAEHVSAEIFSALRTGRDAVTPGLWNKAYLHGISRILPAPALAALHQLAWSPAPAWSSPASWQLPTVKSLSSLPAASAVSSVPPLRSRVQVPSLAELQDIPAVRKGSAAAKKLFRSAARVTEKLRKEAKSALARSATGSRGSPST